MSAEEILSTTWPGSNCGEIVCSQNTAEDDAVGIGLGFVMTSCFTLLLFLII